MKRLLLSDCVTVSFYRDADHSVGFRPLYRVSIDRHSPSWVIPSISAYVETYYNGHRQPYSVVHGVIDSREADRYAPLSRNVMDYIY